MASSADIGEKKYVRLDVVYRGQPRSVVVFRYQGECRSFINLCVHMPRELDCVRSTIFEPSGPRLRCSMHGIVYDPTSGESVSTMCGGQRLTAIQVEEDELGVWLADKYLRPQRVSP